MATWKNADGLEIEYGRSEGDNSDNRLFAVNNLGEKQELVMKVDLAKLTDGVVSYDFDNNNDGTLDGFSQTTTAIPPYASVLRVIFVSTETAAGGTNIQVGTYLADGTTIDADSLVTTTEGITANMAKGERFHGAGALTSGTAGTASVGANPAYVGILPSGTFTAGKGKLIIEYIPN